MSIQLPYNPVPSTADNFWVVPNPLPLASVTWTALPSPSSPPKPSFSSFPRFRLLPPELRSRIWNFAAPRNRVIEIRSWGSGLQPVRFSVHAHRLPTIFRVCQESRREGLRLYKTIEIGVSTAVPDDGREYAPWPQHPLNPHADPRPPSHQTRNPGIAPYPPTKVRLSWSHDIIYLGPEFRPSHLLSFLKCSTELPGLQRLALDRKFWFGWPSDNDVGQWDDLQLSLWSLWKRGNLQEIMVVPDDERGFLIDRWYYGKHDISLLSPDCSYTFYPGDNTPGVTVQENLQEWFDTTLPTEARPEIAAAPGVKGRANAVFPSPTVSVKSVRRNRRKMADFKVGMWFIQAAMGAMTSWKTWKPPAEEF